MLSVEPVKLSGDEKVRADWSPVVAIVAVVPSALFVNDIPVPGRMVFIMLFSRSWTCPVLGMPVTIGA